MDKREEEFLKRLKATFKVEADEHVQTISSGLLDLDKDPDPEEKARILETIYREAHSLKGAARAVSLRDVEKICQATETVLSMLKKEELQPLQWILDTLLDSVEVISKLITTEESVPIGELLQRLADISSGSASPPDRSPSLTQKPAESLIPPEKDRHTAKIDEAGAVLAEESTARIATEKHQVSLQIDSSVQRPEIQPESGEKPSPIIETEPQLKTESPGPETSAPESCADSNLTVQPAPPKQHIEPKRAGQTETIRIKSSKLDTLLYQVEEMVAIKMAANQRVADLRNVKTSLDLGWKLWTKAYPEVRTLKGIVESQESRDTLGGLRHHLLKVMDFLESNETTIRTLESRIRALTAMAENDSRQASAMVDDLLQDMKSVLMLPFSTLLEIFPKLVRDLARDQGKSIKLTIEGGDTEIDRRILEDMKDPLIHLVRNAIDHGLEEPLVRTRNGKPAEGSLSISISQSGAKKAEIIVTDDGVGIDVDKVRHAALSRKLITEQELRNLSDEDAMNLIFRSEISTSAIITDLSGRGLGLAIVREKVEKLGGIVSVESRLGIGTVFRIQLPVTLATFRGTLVQVGAELFVIPTSSVIRVGRVKRDSIKTVENRDTITMNGRVLSLVRLADVLEIQSLTDKDHDDQFVTILVLGAADQSIAFSVNAILNEQEVLVKSLGRQLSRVRNVSAGTVLGSGQVALILNVSDLIRSAMRITGASLIAHTQHVAEESKRKSILVVEDSITSRMLLKNILESAGYDVQTAVDGADAWATLKTGNFDVVVSDIEMPRMDGFELTAKIRSDEKFKNLPVVVVTSLESRQDRERGIDVGANAYIVKSSFDQSNLLSVVKRFV
ncbi:MAG: hybrid sensor histidine kinase/response regulator [Deltaproteobacteria bacterium]|nr:hybrid sensor histidine kinase/response regulator [Deltaproteobacteria bacterium]